MSTTFTIDKSQENQISLIHYVSNDSRMFSITVVKLKDNTWTYLIESNKRTCILKSGVGYFPRDVVIEEVRQGIREFDIPVSDNFIHDLGAKTLVL